jgi:hypothetical protein
MLGDRHSTLVGVVVQCTSPGFLHQLPNLSECYLIVIY